MEAVPKLPVMGFERRTSKVPIDFEVKIKTFIAQFYHEDGESFNYEIKKLNQLRNSANFCANDIAGLEVMKKYYCQLHFLKSRFPMNSGQAVSIRFSWFDPYKNSEYSDDIDYELICILYNIGALHTKLGQKASADDDLKVACSHYQYAAGCFEQLCEKYSANYSKYGDDIKMVQFMNTICLAQAQEFLLEKSLKDNRKPMVIAKIAAQLVTFYKNLKQMQISMREIKSLSYFVNLSDFVNCKKLTELKIACYNCILCFYHGQQAEEEQSMAERIAYYQKASESLNEARKLAKSIKLFQKQIADSLQFTNDVVEGKLKAATGENDYVYHEKVASFDSLTFVQGVSLVKSISFDIHDHEISGDDIFKRLIPMAVHESLSVYSEKKAELIRNISHEIEKKNQDLDSFMLRYKVSYLSILSNKNRQDTVPNELVDRVNALKSRPQVIDELRQGWKYLTTGLKKMNEMLEELTTILNTENDEENAYQEVMGVRPISMPITEINRELIKLNELIQKGDDSNKVLLKAVEINLTNLEILSSSNLLEQLPAIELPDSSEDDAVLKRLQNVLYKIEEMQQQRITFLSKLREDLNQDEIISKVLVHQINQSDLDEIFDNELKKHEQSVTLIQHNLSAQDNILEAFDEAYNQSSSECEQLLESFKKRQLTIHSLISAYDSYEDLTSKLLKAQEFFQKIQTNLTKLIQRAKSIYSIQHEQRESILKSNIKPVLPPVAVSDAINESSSKIPEIKEEIPTSQTPKLKDYLALRKNAKKNDPVSDVINSTNQLHISELEQPPQIYSNSFLPNSALYSNIYNPTLQSEQEIYNTIPQQQYVYNEEFQVTNKKIGLKPDDFNTVEKLPSTEEPIPQQQQQPLNNSVTDGTSYHPFLNEIAREDLNANAYSQMNQLQYSVAGNPEMSMTNMNNSQNFDYSLYASNSTLNQYPTNSYYYSPYSYQQDYSYGFNQQSSIVASESNTSNTINATTQNDQVYNHLLYSGNVANQYQPPSNNYYNLPYGYQQEITYDFNQQPPPQPQPQPQQEQSLTNTKNVTYVHSNNSAETTVTTSSGKTGNSDGNSTKDNAEKKVSNIDLLTGIDFSIDHQPLIPQPLEPKNNCIEQDTKSKKELESKTKIEMDLYDPLRQLDPLYASESEDFSGKVEQ